LSILAAGVDFWISANVNWPLVVISTRPAVL
jgi:hypothetical protein